MQTLKKTKRCPYCGHVRTKQGESFAEIHPELMAEFSINNTIDPYSFMPGSAQSTEWICQKNSKHVWNAPLY